MSNINYFKAGCSYLVGPHSYVRLFQVDKEIGIIGYTNQIAISYIDSDYIVEVGVEDSMFLILNIKLSEPIK